METSGRGATERLGYRPSLDGLRGLAISMVFITHAFGTPHGPYVGVDIFLVLSGFLITTLLLEEWNENAAVSLKFFYARRALRLFPALFAMILAYLAVLIVRTYAGRYTGLDTHGGDYISVLFAPTYLMNFLYAISPGTLAEEVGHLWTLALEEQFYLLWPPVLLLLAKRRWNTAELMKVLLTAIGLILLWRVVLESSGSSFYRIYALPDTRFDTILIGCVLSVWFVARPMGVYTTRKRRALSILSVVALIYLFGAFIFSGTGPETVAWLARWGFISVALSAAIIIWQCLVNPESGIARILSQRHLVKLGKLSYSLYVWHMLVIMNVQVFYNYLGARPGDSLFLYGTVTVAIALLVAQVSYVFIERPFLKRKMRFARSTDQRRSASRRLSGEVGGVPVGLEPMNGFRGDPKAPFPPAL